jgi:hypothetical protein
MHAAAKKWQTRQCDQNKKRKKVHGIRSNQVDFTPAKQATGRCIQAMQKLEKGHIV